MSRSILDAEMTARANALITEINNLTASNNYDELEASTVAIACSLAGTFEVAEANLPTDRTDALRQVVGQALGNKFDILLDPE